MNLTKAGLLVAGIGFIGMAFNTNADPDKKILGIDKNNRGFLFGLMALTGGVMVGVSSFNMFVTEKQNGSGNS